MRSSSSSAPARSTQGPYPYLVLDALEVGCRDGGRTVNACVVHAVAVNRDGYRESLGLDVVTSEDGAAWLAFLRQLLARGLQGVRRVTSDAHPGLVDAIAATLKGASWQRCRTHFMRNLLTGVPKSAQPAAATLVRSIFAQPDPGSVREQHCRIVAQLEGRFPAAAALLDEASAEILAFSGFPQEQWRQLCSTDEIVKPSGPGWAPLSTDRSMTLGGLGGPQIGSVGSFARGGAESADISGRGILTAVRRDRGWGLVSALGCA